MPRNTTGTTASWGGTLGLLQMLSWRRPQVVSPPQGAGQRVPVRRVRPGLPLPQGLSHEPGPQVLRVVSRAALLARTSICHHAHTDVIRHAHTSPRTHKCPTLIVRHRPGSDLPWMLSAFPACAARALICLTSQGLRAGGGCAPGRHGEMLGTPDSPCWTVKPLPVLSACSAQ